VDSVPQKREQLKGIIQNDGIIFREVTLSSNTKSDFYYDIKTVVNTAPGVVLIGELVLNMIVKEFPGTESVGGLESGAIPVSTAIVYYGNQLAEGHKLSGFFVRKQAKKYGLEKMIEGKPKTPMVVVDDVVTTGQSVIDAVDALREAGYSPSGIISVIDREDDRKREELKSGVLKYRSLFKHSEFEAFIKKTKRALKN
jgi:orotate phosphoribosyltransferase